MLNQIDSYSPENLLKNNNLLVFVIMHAVALFPGNS